MRGWRLSAIAFSAALVCGAAAARAEPAPAVPSAPQTPRTASELFHFSANRFAVARVAVGVRPVTVAAPEAVTAALALAPAAPARPRLRPAEDSPALAAPNVFGSFAIPARGLPVADRPMAALARTFAPCPDDDRSCRSLSGDDVQSLLALARPLDPAQQLAVVNRGLNRLVVYVPDSRIYDAEDHWATVAETLANQAGDCEDIAIAKMWMLEQLGFAEMYIVALRDTRRDLDHAVLAVRHRDTMHILDSATGQIRNDRQIASYRPIFSLNRDGVWVHAVPMQPETPAETDAPQS